MISAVRIMAVIDDLGDILLAIEMEMEEEATEFKGHKQNGSGEKH